MQIFEHVIVLSSSHPSTMNKRKLYLFYTTHLTESLCKSLSHPLLTSFPFLVLCVNGFFLRYVLYSLVFLAGLIMPYSTCLKSLKTTSFENTLYKITQLTPKALSPFLITHILDLKHLLNSVLHYKESFHQGPSIWSRKYDTSCWWVNMFKII